MAELSLNIHGHSYGVACDDGQEQRVLEVGEYVNNRAADIASAGAASNETHLLVLTSLVLADEVKELRDHLQSAQANESGAPQTVASGLPEEQQVQIASTLDQLSSQIVNIADRLMK